MINGFMILGRLWPTQTLERDGECGPVVLPYSPPPLVEHRLHPDFAEAFRLFKLIHRDGPP